MSKAPARRIASLKGEMHSNAFAMGFALARDGELLNLRPFRPASFGNRLRSWAQDPHAGLVFIIAAEADVDEEPTLSASEIHLDALAQLEPFLFPVGAALHLT